MLIFTGPFGQTIHPIHFPTAMACLQVAARMYPNEETSCVPVSRPVIMPRRSPLVTPQVDA